MDLGAEWTIKKLTSRSSKKSLWAALIKKHLCENGTQWRRGPIAGYWYSGCLLNNGTWIVAPTSPGSYCHRKRKNVMSPVAYYLRDAFVLCPGLDDALPQPFQCRCYQCRARAAHPRDSEFKTRLVFFGSGMGHPAEHYYVITARRTCKKCGATFNMWDHCVADDLPARVQREIPLTLTARGAVDKQLIIGVENVYPAGLGALLRRRLAGNWLQVLPRSSIHNVPRVCVYSLVGPDVVRNILASEAELEYDSEEE